MDESTMRMGVAPAIGSDVMINLNDGLDAPESVEDVPAPESVEDVPNPEPSGLSLKPTSTTQTVNQNTVPVQVPPSVGTAPGPHYCRSPADIIDIFSDIVDDLAGLTGLSTLVGPLTDADPRTECIHGTIFEFLTHDLEDFLTEGQNVCDTCKAGECEKIVDTGAGEPEIEVVPEVEVSASAPVYIPVGFSSKSIPATPKKKKPKKPNIVAEMPPEEPKKGCCAGCVIV